MKELIYHIDPVPQAQGLIDICLSKTNRQTPTIIRKHYEITRIRYFYIRKIKHATNEFVTRLEKIVNEFPVIEDIHPFYAELIAILYDKDTYKITLGKLNSVKSKLLDIQNNSIKMIKFADSLYRCKCLKRAGLGHMSSIINKLQSELKYLEEVRQHLTRLPIINPHGRIVIIAGFPNVGKSTYLKTISACKTEVQPYAFTTRSLYVGHVEHDNLIYQFIDTPGILDHPLEERNKIEMLSINAMAHLNSTVMYFIDISETCGYSITEQIELFNSICPLLTNKFLIVLSKSDLVKELCLENHTELHEFLKNKPYKFISVYNGFDEVTTAVCNIVLEHRIEQKKNKIHEFTNRIHMTTTENLNPKYDKIHLGTNSFLRINCDNDTYVTDPNEKYDIIPEILNGKNICDFMQNINDGKNLFELLENIQLPTLKSYDCLTPEELELYEKINACRINANMKSIYNKRGFIKKNYAIYDTVLGNENYIKPNSRTVNYNKKVNQNTLVKNTDNNPKHLSRKISNKHPKTR